MKQERIIYHLESADKVAIKKRLKELGQNVVWLAQQLDDCSMSFVYAMLKGEKTINDNTVEKINTILGAEVLK